MLEDFRTEFQRIDPFQTTFRRTFLRRHLYASFKVPPDVDFVLNFGRPGRAWVYDRTELGKGVHEPGLVKAMIALRRVMGPLDQRAFYDVGSLFGYVALVGAAISGASETLAFEMNPQSAAVARNNASLNPKLGVEVLQLGLTSETSPAVPCLYHSFTLKVRPSEEESAELRASGFREALIGLSTLDDIAADRATAPGIVKIDVEGSQMSIIQGADKVLRSARPALLIEADSPDAPNGDGATMSDLCDLLITTYGYRIAMCDHRHWEGALRMIGTKREGFKGLEKNQLLICLPAE